jgi:predicted dehydrogenase
MLLKYLPKVKLVAVAHDNSSQLKEFSAHFGVRNTSADMEEVIRRRDVDAIILTAYSSCHLELVRVACEEGKHVFCDKPIEISIKKTHEMIRNVEKAGIKFMMGHAKRSNPLVRKAAELIKDGAIGEVVAFNDLAHAPLPQKWITDKDPGWYVEPEKAGYGGFIDHAVHSFDALRFILGKEGKSVLGAVDNLVYKDIKVEDYGAALAEFEGGIRGVVESSWIIVPPGRYTDYTSFKGTEGNIVLNGEKIIVNGKLVKDVIGKSEVTLNPVVLEWFRPIPGVMEYPIDLWYPLLKDFVDTIREDREPPQTIYDGLKSLQLCVATYESAKRQRSVTISELD